MPVGGLPVDQPQIVTARAFKCGMEPSNAASNNYAFFVLTPAISPVRAPNLRAVRAITQPGPGGKRLLHPRRHRANAVVAQAIGLDTGVDPDDAEGQGLPGNWTPERYARRHYYFNYGTLPTPTASPGGGSYTTDQTVALALPGGPGSAVIRYTLDGSTPGTGSPLYTAPITVSVTRR